ncbi:RluA family pseudouridine synthase [Bacteroidota bacterium]
MRKVETYFVPKNFGKKVRLSDLEPGIFSTIQSRKGVKKAIDKGLVTVNGNTGHTADYITGGEVIELHVADRSTANPNIDLKIEVVFEDDYLAIISKPAGIVVSGNQKWTLKNALSSNLKKSLQADALISPEPIHRLDYPTSGCLLVGKTAQAVVALNSLFANREVKKQYTAVSIGKMPADGTVTSPVDDKPANTLFNTIESIESVRFGFLNLVNLQPLTGRKHQLRKHLSEIGNPILGDRDYAQKGLLLSGKGLYLHASALGFKHPFTLEQIAVSIPLPKKFRKLFPV